MPVANFNVTQSTQIVAASQVAQDRIKILFIWYEVSANATLVCLRFGQTGQDWFPKTFSGLAIANLIGTGHIVIGPALQPLWIIVNPTGIRVRGTIVWKYK